MASVTKDLIDAINAMFKRKTSEYDATATVKRIEGNRAWVHINGGVDETPVDTMTIDASVGDTVRVHVGGGKAWITGNATEPPTGDREARKAHKIAYSAYNQSLQMNDKLLDMGIKVDETGDMAVLALTSADGKSTVYHSAVEPTGGDYKVGDTWFDADDDNKIYKWSGTAWVAVALGDDAISDLSANKLTAGTIDASQITVSNIDAGNITAGKLSADRINVSAIHVGDLYDDGTYLTQDEAITITNVAYAYQLSTNGTTPPTGEWSSTPVAPTATQYAWTRTTTTYSDGTIVTTYTVGGKQGIQGIQGEKGDDGDSITITSQTVRYQSSTSGTTIPTGTWESTVPSVSAGNYLWTRTIVNYSDGTSTTSYSVARQGENGADTSSQYMEFTSANGLRVYSGDKSSSSYNTSYTQIKSNGTDIVSNGTTLAHFGYDTGQAESGTATAPYYTLGTRASDTASTRGNYSVVEGINNTASGRGSHAEGLNCVADGEYSHASGEGTVAYDRSQFVIGSYNKDSGTSSQDYGYAFIIGNGNIRTGTRSNAFTVDTAGNVDSSGRMTHVCYTNDIDEMSVSTTNSPKKIPIRTIETFGDGSAYFQRDVSSQGITVIKKGIYIISVQAGVNPATSGDLMGLEIYKNGSSAIGPEYRRVGGNYDTVVLMPTVVSLSAGDVLTLYGRNNTSARGTFVSCRFTIHRI